MLEMSDLDKVEKPKEYFNFLQRVDEFLMRLQDLEAEYDSFGLCFFFGQHDNEEAYLKALNEGSMKERGSRKLCLTKPLFEWAKTKESMRSFLSLMLASGYIEQSPVILSGEFQRDGKQKRSTKLNIERCYGIAPDGYKRLSELRKSVNSSQVFVSMWFDKQTDETYRVIHDLIKNTGLVPYRVDKDPVHDEFIVPRIISQIEQSKFVIADLKGNRGGVYWEMGYARAKGRTVLILCKEDDFKEDTEKPHFNVQQLQLIVWKDYDQLKERLDLSIKALLAEESLSK